MQQDEPTMRERPIGVFDSGLGGLTVLQALDDLLPNEHFVYLGDTARYPYGDKSLEELRSFSREIAGYLRAQGAKLLVVACNSATAAALEDLRAHLPVPVVGVVEPGLRAAASTSRTHRTVVIGTRATAASRVYETAAESLGLDLGLHTVACPEFVHLVEQGTTEGERAERVVADRLAPLLTARVDTLVLGCTHFPLLARTLAKVVGRGVTVVSSADETAFEVRDLLQRTGWLRRGDGRGSRTFVTTGDAARFDELGERFFGEPLGDVRHLSLAQLATASWEDHG